MIRFLYANPFDVGSLTASSEAAGYPVSNLRHPFRGKTHRTAGITSEWVKNDSGTAISFNAMAIVNHNLVAGDNVTLQANVTDVWTAPSFSQALTVTSGIIIAFFAAQSYRWTQLLITKAAGTYIEMGRVFIGTYYEPTRNYSAAWENAIIDPSVTAITLGQQEHCDKVPQHRELSLKFSLFDKAQKDALEAMFKAVGVHTPFIVSIDPADASTAFYVRHAASPHPVADREFPMGDRFNSDMALKEVL